MKGTEHFKEIIQNYLEQRKAEDALFREKAERINRPIDDIITAILNYVQKSGCCGYSDEEIYGLATHFAEEETIEIGKPIQGQVVVNHHIDLTEEEKAEQRANALKRYQEEEYRKLQQRNSKPKAVKPQTQAEPSLFDF
jgi:hypothetical protein